MIVAAAIALVLGACGIYVNFANLRDWKHSADALPGLDNDPTLDPTIFPGGQMGLSDRTLNPDTPVSQMIRNKLVISTILTVLGLGLLGWSLWDATR